MSGRLVLAFSTRWFRRWARREGVTDPLLCAALDEMHRGLVDADLGAGLFKKRVGRPGQGKRGGLRTLVASNRGDRWFFVYGFAKNARSDIGQDDAVALKRLATELLTMPLDRLALAVAAGELSELHCNAETPLSDPRRRP